MAKMQGKKAQTTLAICVLVGLTVFVYQMADVIGKIQSWEVIWNPPTVSQMLLAVAGALAAGLAALGVDVPALTKHFAPGLFRDDSDA